MGPPKPRLVLRIGVTGHRPKNFAEDAQLAVRKTLNNLFGEMAESAAKLYKLESEFFDSAPPQFRIVSALAEGADSVVAEAGLQAGFALDVVLPFTADVYEADFKTSTSKERFRELLACARARFILPGKRNEQDPVEANRAYEAAGLMTIRQCDLLISVWDGKEASGRGGTEDIVQHAVTTGRPVLWFDEKGNGPFLLQGNSIEPVDARDLAKRASKGLVADSTTVNELVGHLCAPPTVPAKAAKYQKKSTEKARKQLRRFFDERERFGLYTAFSYPLLLSVLSDKAGFWRSLRQQPYEEAAKADWKEYRAVADTAPALVRKPIYEIILPRFAWADNLANRYGQRHRSGYVSNFALATFAVLFATIGLRWSAPLAEWFELGAILLVVSLTLWGLFLYWHERWLDYRQLSAQLRQLRALVLTGSSSWEARTPHTGEELQAGQQWVNWYYRMTAREIGVIDTEADDAYLHLIRQAIRRGEIKDQIMYHLKNARRMKSVAKWLERLGYSAFVITLVICAFEVAASSLGWIGKLDGDCSVILRVLPVVLPAFGAALFGIRVQGDFEGSAHRSTDMKRRLVKISARLNGKKPISFAEISALTEYAAIIMASELGDWGFVYRGRPLALPT
ncbi:MAG: DUF4231 domain-containing protein [Terriglobia bacterium]|nr:DUF4231 domain-containing protein [Terriglobia bacterium]